MTSRDYTKVAEVIQRQVLRANQIAQGRNTIHSNFAIGIHSAASVIAGELADEMEKDNPRFQRDEFMRACGLE